MEISIFLAQVWGLYLVIVSLAFLANRNNVRRIIRVSNETFLMMTGFIALLIGIISVLIHNVWVADWRVIITVFGWLSLVKGAARLFWPELAVNMIKVLKNKNWIVTLLLLISLIIGIYLVYMGFFNDNIFY